MLFEITSWADIGALATSVSAICTLGVLFLTWKTVNEMVKNRIDLSRPIVIVDYEFNNGLFYLYIENTGQTQALDVSVHIPEAIYGAGGINEDLRDLLFKEKINTFPPGKKIKTFIDSAIGIFRKEKFLLKQNILIEYKDNYGNLYTEQMAIDISIYKNLSYTKSELTKVANSIKGIENQLKETNFKLDKIIKNIK